MYNSFLARSFSRHEQKRLGYGAIICCLTLVLFFFTLFKPHLSPLPNALNLQVSMGVGLKMLALKSTNTSQQMVPKSALKTNQQKRNLSPHNQPESLNKEVVCDTEAKRNEFCEINTSVRIDSKSASVLVESDSFTSTVIIRPYARKEDSWAMRNVRKWSVLASQETSPCTRNHTMPAVLFSLDGYVGNNFHEFTDVVVPLFINSRRFKGEVRFVVTNYKLYFVKKFEKLLKGLSNYEPIDIDRESEQVHCFPSATVGLKRHEKEMSIDPEKHSTSMKEFRDFLRSSYSLNKEKAIRIEQGDDNLRRKKPRLLILSRRRTRAFTNTDAISKMARSLGYKVMITEADSNLNRFSEIVNSCDVLMGVHGAGLTNIVFLPENAVFIQIVPFGVEWLASTDFALPSKDMNLNYLEYKITKEESTLINQYPIDHEVFTDPNSFAKKGWEYFKSIFLVKQNVNLDVNRFKPTLVKALELLRM